MGKLRPDSKSKSHPSTLRMTDMPYGYAPRERLKLRGAEALGTPELLAILLRTGMKGENVLAMASRILSDFGGISGSQTNFGLKHASYEELTNIKGVSDAKACQVLAALELGRRIHGASKVPVDQIKLQGPKDIVAAAYEMVVDKSNERFVVITANTKNLVEFVEILYEGTSNSAAVKINEVFRSAIRGRLSAIAVVHNHPSGDPQPSREDLNVTRKIVEAGKALDVRVLDHVVVGSKDSWVSIRDQGLVNFG